jgi:hypothetical protein
MNNLYGLTGIDYEWLNNALAFLDEYITDELNNDDELNSNNNEYHNNSNDQSNDNYGQHNIEMSINNVVYNNEQLNCSQSTHEIIFKNNKYTFKDVDYSRELEMNDFMPISVESLNATCKRKIQVSENESKKMKSSPQNSQRIKAVINDGLQEIEDVELLQLFSNYIDRGNNVLQVGGGTKKFQVVQTKDNKQHYKKWNTTGSEFQVVFRDLPTDNIELERILSDAIQTALDMIFENTGRHDRVQITIDHQDLDQPIQIPYLARNEITEELILTRIEQVCQSKKTLKLDLSMKIYVSTIHSFEASGNNNVLSRLGEFLQDKKSVLEIKNDDNYCLLRCVIIGMANADYQLIKKLLNVMMMH